MESSGEDFFRTDNGSMSTLMNEGNEPEDVLIQLQDKDVEKDFISFSREEDDDSFFEREEFLIQIQEND